MGSSLPDKRILKAFYTQYISVLLIILVFTAGRVGSVRKQDFIPKMIVEEKSATLGAVSIRTGADASGTLSEEADSALEAVSKVLLNHDVTATVKISVNSHPDSDAQLQLERALATSHKFRAVLVEHGVPEHAVRSVIVRGGAETGAASISFSPSEELDEN